jgi:hypothetical protein
MELTNKFIKFNIPNQNLESGTYCLSAEIAFIAPAQFEAGIQPILPSSINLRSRLLRVI